MKQMAKKKAVTKIFPVVRMHVQKAEPNRAGPAACRALEHLP